MHHLSRTRRVTHPHLLLGFVLLAVLVLALHGQAIPATLGFAGIALILAHLAVGAVVLGTIRHTVQNHSEIGHTLHGGRAYDLLAFLYTMGQESRVRGLTLDAAQVAPGERVLDVCCGTGTLALAARERVGPNGTVTGIDASPEMIARAREKVQGEVELLVAAAQELPFPDASFDVVFCTLGYHHLPASVREPALREMRRVLRPGGRVVIVEFTRSSGLAALHPVALLHARHAPDLLAEATATMAQVGLADVRRAPLGFRGLGYATGIA